MHAPGVTPGPVSLGLITRLNWMTLNATVHGLCHLIFHLLTLCTWCCCVMWVT